MRQGATWGPLMSGQDQRVQICRPERPSGSGLQSQGGWVGGWRMWDERMGWEDRLGTGWGDGWGGLLGLGGIR